MKTNEEKMGFAAEVLEFLDNHEEWSNINKADVLAICMGHLLARMRPGVMKSLMPEYLKAVERHAIGFAKVLDERDGKTEV